MIIRIHGKQSLSINLLAYNEKKVAKGEAERLDKNLLSDDLSGWVKEFNLINSMRDTITKPMKHISVNFPPGEQVSKEVLRQIANEIKTGLGYDNNPYIVFHHSDRDHDHIHIILSRIKYEGIAVPDGKEIKKCIEIARQLEIKHGLIQVSSKNKSKTKPISKGQIEKFMRTGEVPIKAQIPVIIDKALETTTTLESFTKHLQCQGVNIQLHHNKKGIFGISYEMDGVKFKGSQLGKAYTWKNIKNQLKYEQIRHLESFSPGGNITKEQTPDGPGGKITGDQLLEHSKNATGNAAYLQEHEGFGNGTSTRGFGSSQDFGHLEGDANRQSAYTPGTPPAEQMAYIPGLFSGDSYGSIKQHDNLADDEDLKKKQKKRKKKKSRSFTM